MPDINAFITKIDQAGLSEDSKKMMKLFVTFFNEFHTNNDDKIQELNDEVKSLRERVEKLEHKVEDQSQNNILDQLVISPKDNGGLPVVTKDENPKQIVRKLFQDHLSLELTENDISSAHRIGKIKVDPVTKKPAVDRRRILVRLGRKDLIPDIFTHCKESDAPFFVNESLTPTRGKICYILRKLKKKFSGKITKVHTYKGVPRVFLKSNRPGPSTRTAKETFIEIPTILKLESFVTDHLETTLLELSRDPDDGFTY